MAGKVVRDVPKVVFKQPSTVQKTTEGDLCNVRLINKFVATEILLRAKVMLTPKIVGRKYQTK